MEQEAAFPDLSNTGVVQPSHTCFFYYQEIIIAPFTESQSNRLLLVQFTKISPTFNTSKKIELK